MIRRSNNTHWWRWVWGEGRHRLPLDTRAKDECYCLFTYTLLMKYHRLHCVCCISNMFIYTFNAWCLIVRLQFRISVFVCITSRFLAVSFQSLCARFTHSHSLLLCVYPSIADLQIYVFLYHINHINTNHTYTIFA